MNISIQLSDTQASALTYFAEDGGAWATNAVTERCRVAIDDIVQITVAKCLETNTQIPGSKEEMVTLAFAQGWVKTAAQRKAEAEAEQAARIAAAEAEAAQSQE